MAANGLQQTMDWLRKTLVPATLPDEKLLQEFISRRDEMAFAALVRRHGPMVLGVCKRILGNHHDAEDVVQATFLLLAQKAPTVSCGAALASWLYMCAYRIALKAKAKDSRRRQKEMRMDEMAHPFTSSPVVQDWEALLDDELCRLPEKYRLPILLCDLEGRSRKDVERQLGIAAGTLSSRLTTARKMLATRLTRRGLAGGALTTALAPGEAALPPNLAAAISKNAVLVAAGQVGTISKAVLILMEERARAMVIAKLKATMVGLFIFATLGFGGLIYSGTGQGIAPSDAPVRPMDRADNVAPSQPVPKQADVPVKKFQLIGVVRAEDDGEPVKDARIEVKADLLQTAISGDDGRFVVNLPPGHFAIEGFVPPDGFWDPRPTALDNAVVSAAEPVVQKEFRLRRGTVWEFKVTRNIGLAEDLWANVLIGDPLNSPMLKSSNRVTDAGKVRVTLPREMGTTFVRVGQENVGFEWDTDFRTDAVISVEPVKVTPKKWVKDRGFRLTDASGKKALVRGDDLAEPTLLGRMVVINVTRPEWERSPAHDPKTLGELVGQIIDGAGGPVGGAKVKVYFPSELNYLGKWIEVFGHPYPPLEATTDAQGTFRIKSIPRHHKLLVLSVAREGFATNTVPKFKFEPGADAPHIAVPVRLEPGNSVSGIVLDPQRRPAIGALVNFNSSPTERGHTKTDERGHFTIRDLPEGKSQVWFSFGNLHASEEFVAERRPKSVTVNLRPGPTAAEIAESNRALSQRVERDQQYAVGVRAFWEGFWECFAGPR